MPARLLPPRAELVALYESGVSRTELAQRYGVGRRSVGAALRRAGIYVDVPALADRFWSKVDRSGPPSSGTPTLGGCWLWTSSKTTAGYGQFMRSDQDLVLSHRMAWELTHGSAPADGLVLDHLCRNRACVNPAHLQATTHRVNILRGVGRSAIHAAQVACIHGHPFDEENTYVWRGRKRICRQCRRDRRVAAARNQA